MDIKHVLTCIKYNTASLLVSLHRLLYSHEQQTLDHWHVRFGCFCSGCFHPVEDVQLQSRVLSKSWSEAPQRGVNKSDCFNMCQWENENQAKTWLALQTTTWTRWDFNQSLLISWAITPWISNICIYGLNNEWWVNWIHIASTSAIWAEYNDIDVNIRTEMIL